ncbi:MAG: hypothetical protein ACXVIQ_12065, partial [Ilumatobacteraceae bacterium]
VDTGHANCLAFERDGVLIVLNADADEVELPAALVAGRSVILATQSDTTPQRLPGDTCVWLSAVH